MNKNKKTEELQGILIDTLVDLGMHEIPSIFAIGNLRSIKSFTEMSNYIKALKKGDISESQIIHQSKEICKKYGELKTYGRETTGNK